MARRDEQKAYDEDAGVSIRTWIGTAGPAASSSTLAEITKHTNAVHFVLVESLKTYPLTVVLKAAIESSDPKVRFEGGSHVSSYAWSKTITVLEERKCVDDVHVKRKKSGEEVITLRWNVNDGFPSQSQPTSDPILELPVVVK